MHFVSLSVQSVCRNNYEESGARRNRNWSQIGGRNINNLRYADDTSLLAETKDGLKHLITRVKEKSEDFGLFLNIKKTKIMTTANESISIKVDNEDIECVDEFIFLGCQINKNGENSLEI